MDNREKENKKILKKMNGLEAEDGIMTISQMKIDFQIDMI